MNKLTFILLKSIKDKDLEYIKENYANPSVERFVDINKKKYWTYVTETENVHFYKIYNDGLLVGTLQCELYEGILYLAVVVFPEYQSRRIGTDAIKSVIAGKTGLDFNEIRVSIDEKNTASVRLFQSTGFVCTGQDGGLVDFHYIM